MTTTLQTPAESSEFILTLPDDPASGKDWYLWAALLALMVLVAFFPAAFGKLIWDDDVHVGVINALPTFHGLQKIWFQKGDTPQYYPLTFTSFWIEYKFWQESTVGYHVVNMLLHAGSAILVWRLLRRLAVPGAWVAAAIWAIHPLQAESVCWISERKNVLSGLFFFASIWFYLEFAGLIPGAHPPVDSTTPAPKGAVREGTARNRSAQSVSDSKPSRFTVLLGNCAGAWWLSLACFVLALLSKSVTCAMPAIMLILLWWKGRRVWDRKTLLPLAPFFAAGVLMAAVTVYMETAAGGTVGAHGKDWALDPVQRLLIAGRALWFYAFKLVWPTRLAFSYKRVDPTVEYLGTLGYALQWLYVVGFIAVTATLWLKRKTLGRGPIAAVMFYFVALFPALGFINVYPMRYSFVADHFQYVAGLGLIVLAVGSVQRLLASSACTGKRVDAKETAPAQTLPHGDKGAATGISARTIVTICVASLLLVGLGFAARIQAHIYESKEALWRDTLAKNPESWMAADNLGIELMNLAKESQGNAQLERIRGQDAASASDFQAADRDYAQAEELFHQVLALRPDHYLAHNSLGRLYRILGRFDEAERESAIAANEDLKDDKAHQTIAPYLNYAEILIHNHPEADVMPWLQHALDLEGQHRITAKDIAAVHLVAGQCLFLHAKMYAPDDATTRPATQPSTLSAMQSSALPATQASALPDTRPSTADPQKEADSLLAAIHELELGLATLPDDLDSRFTLARAYQVLGVLNQQQAEMYRKKGDLQQAEQYAYLSLKYDDAKASENYRKVLLDSPMNMHAGASHGMGMLFTRHIYEERDRQYDAIQDLQKAMGYFKIALQVDPKVPGGKEDLANAGLDFLKEGEKAEAADATWAPLRQKVEALKAALSAAGPNAPANALSAVSTAASDADTALGKTLWILSPRHPMEIPLRGLRTAIRGYLGVVRGQSSLATAAPLSLSDAMKNLQMATSNVLDHWSDRNPRIDAVAEAMAAANCYEDAMAANDNDAMAWEHLNAVAARLQAAMAAQPNIPGAKESLEQAKIDLRLFSPATQQSPATQPVAATQPAAR